MATGGFETLGRVECKISFRGSAYFPNSQVFRSRVFAAAWNGVFSIRGNRIRLRYIVRIYCYVLCRIFLPVI